MEGNASAYYKANPVSRVTGEGRAEFLRTWGSDFDKKGRRGRRGVSWYKKARKQQELPRCTVVAGWKPGLARVYTEVRKMVTGFILVV